MRPENAGNERASLAPPLRWYPVLEVENDRIGTVVERARQLVGVMARRVEVAANRFQGSAFTCKLANSAPGTGSWSNRTWSSRNRATRFMSAMSGHPSQRTRIH
jgi:hypothetical protein